jgi:hypothetical protein
MEVVDDCHVAADGKRSEYERGIASPETQPSVRLVLHALFSRR